MVLDVVLGSIAITALLAGAYADVKTKEVPDWVSYALIFGGLGIRLIFSLAEYNWTIFFEGLVGFVVFVVLAYLMYYLGQWGGGDAKLLMGMGAIIGLSFDFPAFPKLAIFLINLALIGAVYGMGWLIFLAFKNKKNFLKEFEKQQKGIKWLSVAFLAIAVVIAVAAFFLNHLLRWPLIVLGVIPVVSLYTWVLVNAIEKVSFYKKVDPKELTEGDWIAKDVLVDGEKICGPRDLGVSEEQIATLVSLKHKGKIDKILVKEGIPFVPSFLLAFMATLMWGSWWLNFIL